MKIEVKDLLPNPFRHTERYPIRPEKVEALKASINTTSFWDNLVARKAPANGKYELAYGHHRLAALRDLKIEAIDIPVRTLTDDTMLKIMALENMEEYGALALVQQETVRAVVEAFAEGKIKLAEPPMKDNTKFRVAPGYGVVANKSTRVDLSRVYTAETIAEFLGWKKSQKVKLGGWSDDKVADTLTVLADIEAKVIENPKVFFKDLSPRQATEVVRQIRFVEKETGDKGVAAQIGQHLADEFRSTSGEGSPHGRSKKDRRRVSIHTARDRAEELIFEYGVEKDVKKAKAKKAKAKLEKENRQVKEFLDWLKGLLGQMRTYVTQDDGVKVAVSKFSPEAKRFAVRRIDKLIGELTKMKEVLK
jgi:hypothetical protein